jgi:hypothetical protein
LQIFYRRAVSLHARLQLKPLAAEVLNSQLPPAAVEAVRPAAQEEAAEEERLVDQQAPEPLILDC